jgi:hypothetical protein
MDYRKIAIRVSVMNEMQLLFAPEPRTPLQMRFLRVVFLVEKDVRVERCRTRERRNDEKIERQQKVRTRACQNDGNEEIRRRVAFVAEIRLRDKMGVGVMRVMEVDVVVKNPVVSHLIVDQRLTERHDQMGSYRNQQT